LKVSTASIKITQDVPCEGYLVGFNLVCGCVHTCVCTCMGKRKSKLHVLCSYLLIGLIMSDDQSSPDWLHTFSRA